MAPDLVRAGRITSELIVGAGALLSLVAIGLLVVALLIAASVLALTDYAAYRLGFEHRLPPWLSARLVAGSIGLSLVALLATVGL